MARKQTLQAHIAALLKSAASLTRTAHDDVLKRADRIDALDAIGMARKKLAQAEACIKETLPFK